MKLEFDEPQTAYASGSQSARAWTEDWVRAQMYCPNCGRASMSPFPNNSPLADFFCASCSEEYELKSQRNRFGDKVLDGEFRTKCERLAASNNPNLFLMNYDRDERRISIFSSYQSTSLCGRLLRNESRWLQQPGGLAGSGPKFY